MVEKMEIRLADEKGFCFGVRRAIDLAQKAVTEQGAIESLGAIVHNKQVVDALAAQGMRTIRTLDEMAGDTLLVPSHGIKAEILAEAERLGLKVIDATCPIVRNAQKVAHNLSEEGYTVVVFGDNLHTEVEGLLSRAGENAIATTDMPRFDKPPRRIGILSQTTQSQKEFADFVSRLIRSELARLSEIRVFNTICDATGKRQAAALKLASEVDWMLVIGGRDSANTRHLAEICQSAGVETLHIETANELELIRWSSCSRVGLTAGASTPEWVIEEVIKKLEQGCPNVGD